ncbi:MAG: SMP-30/gluconolactonase/LRE family protein [Geobacteraceae bacterium]|nr:SMP-30/gluconolactonase/LRE family protein [Geobacteraceae bacterium]
MPIDTLAPESEESIVLPLPPETPQVRYLYSIRAPQPANPKGKAEAILKQINQENQPREEGFRFKSPISVTADPVGTIYVADQAESVLLELKTESREWKAVELVADKPLSSLIGIAVDEKGTLYLTDSVLKKVYRMRYDHGRLEPFAGDYQFAWPTGVAVDRANERVYVTDTVANKVVTFDMNGVKVGEFGTRGNGDGEFNYPTFITCDPQGNLYVADTLNFRVQSFTADGKFRFSIGSLGDGHGQFSVPKGVAVAPDGTIYVVDGRLDRVQAFAPDGKYLFEFGASGNAPGKFWSPNGIYVDAKDRLYVCDYLNNRVQVFQHLGEK